MVSAVKKAGGVIAALLLGTVLLVFCGTSVAKADDPGAFAVNIPAVAINGTSNVCGQLEADAYGGNIFLYSSAWADAYVKDGSAVKDVTTSDPNIVDVRQEGGNYFWVATGEGTATVTVSANDDQSYDSFITVLSNDEVRDRYQFTQPSFRIDNLGDSINLADFVTNSNDVIFNVCKSDFVNGGGNGSLEIESSNPEAVASLDENFDTVYDNGIVSWTVSTDEARSQNNLAIRANSEGTTLLKLVYRPAQTDVTPINCGYAVVYTGAIPENENAIVELKPMTPSPEAESVGGSPEASTVGVKVPVTGDASSGFVATIYGAPAGADIKLTANFANTGEVVDILKAKAYTDDPAALMWCYSITLYVNGAETHADFGTLTLQFPIGTKYNGWTSRVYHCVGDDTSKIEMQNTGSVANGLVTATGVKSLSTFLVAAKTATDTSSSSASSSSSSAGTTSQGSDFAKTGDDAIPQLTLVLIGVLSAAIMATSFAMARRKEEDGK